ncbi:23S rRNA methyltransferase attenuation leader peptide, partial [Enterococcus faecium]|nr:23S rRNA methyltransferase attenuation leader peptide [Enterococcus faecium]
MRYVDKTSTVLKQTK